MLLCSVWVLCVVCKRSSVWVCRRRCNNSPILCDKRRRELLCSFRQRYDDDHVDQYFFFIV